jgi:hypothetical protein
LPLTVINDLIGSNYPLHQAHFTVPTGLSNHIPDMAFTDVIVTLNVGGELFQTTAGMLARAGTSSPLSSLSTSTPADPHFLDCDPRPFVVLLSFLWCDHLPSPTSTSLLAEAHHFTLESTLLPTGRARRGMHRPAPWPWRRTCSSRRSHRHPCADPLHRGGRRGHKHPQSEAHR